MVPNNWNGLDLMKNVDGLITYHGTSAIEFASLGKPVLIPDKGRYEKSGFVLHAKSRLEYINYLKSNWLNKINLIETKKYSEYFAGWFFCHPEWQKDFRLDDDMKQDHIYQDIIYKLENNLNSIKKETKLIKKWYFSKVRHYHSFKIKNAKI